MYSRGVAKNAESQLLINVDAICVNLAVTGAAPPPEAPFVGTTRTMHENISIVGNLGDYYRVGEEVDHCHEGTSVHVIRPYM